MFEKQDAVIVDTANIPTWKNILREVVCAINARKEITFQQFVAKR